MLIRINKCKHAYTDNKYFYRSDKMSLFNIDVADKEELNDYYSRSHQDNFYSTSAYNNEWQYCYHCGGYERFEYDRCSKCKNN